MALMGKDFCPSAITARGVIARLQSRVIARDVIARCNPHEAAIGTVATYAHLGPENVRFNPKIRHRRLKCHVRFVPKGDEKLL